MPYGKETAMDTTVTRIAEVVVAELRTAGYTESTIGQYGKSIKALTSFVEDRGGAYTPSIGAAFASMTVSPRTGRFSAQRRSDYGRLVNVFDTYLDTGRVVLEVRKRGGGGAQPESSEFAALNTRGRPTWTIAVWRRPRALLTGGSHAATWSSWNPSGSTVWTPPMAPAFWGSWNRCRTGGRSPPCSGWCRTSVRS